VLPAAAWSEHGGSYTSGSGVIQSFGKAVAPPGAAKPDWEILSMVAKAMDRDLGLGSVEEIRRSYVERWFPGAKILKAGVYSGEDLEEEASGAGAPPAAGMLEVGYTISPPTLAAGELMLVTGPMRGHSGILSTYSGAITSVFPEPVASMHPDDALGMGVEDGDSINVRSSSGEISIKVRHDEEIKKGVIFIPVHFTEPPVLDLFTNDACLGGMPVKVRITPLAIPRSAEARQLLH
jgi:predicted molibdopterin-dependent oxidoreductase YjgC